MCVSPPTGAKPNSGWRRPSCSCASQRLAIIRWQSAADCARPHEASGTGDGRLPFLSRTAQTRLAVIHIHLHIGNLRGPLVVERWRRLVDRQNEELCNVDVRRPRCDPDDLQDAKQGAGQPGAAACFSPEQVRLRWAWPHLFSYIQTRQRLQACRAVHRNVR